MGTLLSFGGGCKSTLIPTPGHPPSPLFTVIGGRLACLLLQNASSSVRVRGDWPSWPLWEAGFRLHPPSPPTPTRTDKSQTAPDLSALWLSLSLSDSFSQPHLGGVLTWGPWGALFGGASVQAFGELGRGEQAVDEAELCQGPGQGLWCGLRGLSCTNQVLGLAWKQRSEEGTLRLIPPPPHLRGSCSVLPLWALRRDAAEITRKTSFRRVAEDLSGENQCPGEAALISRVFRKKALWDSQPIGSEDSLGGW